LFLYGDLTVASVLKFTHTVTERVLRYVVIDARRTTRTSPTNFRPPVPRRSQRIARISLALRDRSQIFLAETPQTVLSGCAVDSLWA
jgi:hypothetical protein